MKNKFLVCAYRPWNIKLFQEKISFLPHQFRLITSREELTESSLTKLKPKLIFFLDWSWIVPENIMKKYRCVAFHPSDLPKFRGGSPIQNQIVRGVKKTKLSAFLMNEKIDAGDILLKENLSLEGHLHEVVERISELSFGMIKKIVAGIYTAKKQHGRSIFFRRRKPYESELKKSDLRKSLPHLYDFIRMLEDPYPNAFLQAETKKIVFKSVEYSSNRRKLIVTAEIIEEGAEKHGKNSGRCITSR